MKKLFITLLSVGVFAFAANAQSNQKAADVKTVSKADKEKAKQAKEENEKAVQAFYKEMGLTDEQIAQINAANKEASEKARPIKKDASLSEEEKKAQLKSVYDEKNARIKQVMGKEKYKQFHEWKRKQNADTK